MEFTFKIGSFIVRVSLLRAGYSKTMRISGVSLLTNKRALHFLLIVNRNRKVTRFIDFVGTVGKTKKPLVQILIEHNKFTM